MRRVDRPFRFERTLRAWLAVSLTVLASAALAEPAGRVLLAAGDVFAVRAGRSVKLATGASVESSDLLRTGPGSHLHVRMTDESLIALKPDSALALERYAFAGRADGSESAFMRLVKGGFRTVTGLIGRTNRNTYRVSAGPATIGIRGTAFTLALCDAGSCIGAGGTPAHDGLYGNVTEGQVTARNRAGEFAFSAGQTFFAPSLEEAIRTLPAPPPFVAGRLETQRRADASRTGQRENADERPRDRVGEGGTGPRQEGAPGDGTPRDRPRDRTVADRVDALRRAGDITVEAPRDGSAPNAPLLPDPARQGLDTALKTIGPPPVVVGEVLNGDGQTNIVPPVSGFMVAYPYPTGFRFETAASPSPAPGGFDAVQRLIAFDLGANGAGSLAQGTIVDQGGIASGQTLVRWGRWDNAVVRAPDNVTRSGASLLYFTFNDILPGVPLPDLPKTGTVTYVNSVGPAPLGFDPAIPAGGIRGQVTAAQLAVNFTSAQATLDMTMRFDIDALSLTKIYSMTGSAALLQPGGRIFAGSLSETCANSPCSGPGAVGTFNVGVAGLGGYGIAAATGGFADTRSTFSASFVRVFQAPVGPNGGVLAPAAIPAAQAQ